MTLTLEALTLRQHRKTLAMLDASIAPGEVLTIMGPSGAGKSTLLAAILGTLPRGFSMTGRVVLDGRDVTALPVQDRRIGILYQDDVLFPHLSVGQNLGFALPPGTQDRASRIAAALAEADLAGFQSRDPATLSGGQRSRVALMRALLADPRALLLDEPFSRLDLDLRDRIRRLVFDTARSRGLPVVLVTHDPADAEAAGGPVLRLETPRGQSLSPG